MTRRRTASILAALTLLATAGCGSEASEGTGGPAGDMILATTTSTQDSGLLDAILPEFEDASGCVPKTVAVGSGQAMTMGEKGDADALLVHSPDAEKAFMAAGNGASREPVMHNDFVLVGPPKDPAGIGEASDAAAAMRLVSQQQAPFASRADDSGTNAKELSLWEEADIEPSGSWYVETGKGMGETLTIANQKQAYTLADRGTFLATSNLESEIAFEGSPDLRNPYHVIVVASDNTAGATNEPCAKEFSEWIRSEPVQRSIADVGVEEHGQQLFFPDVHD
ncbi:MAG: tungsten ABC transporter substrate-binding protein [Actinophytocola sp.]|nr:tungsten ABC transporter substrate-binding protein [Actinophytocola sp.]